MTEVTQPVEITALPRLNPHGPDDLFICSASFEERSLSAAALMKREFLQKYAVIFNVEDPQYAKQVEKNLFRLQTELRNKTTEGVFIITCQRENPVDGVQQLVDILKQCKLNTKDGPFITVDISSFTKIYLLELLHLLVVRMELPMPRLLHTTQQYLPSRLTRGVEQISTIPHFYGTPSLEKPTLLVLFLGFETDRAISIWKQYNPARTITLITNPPRQGNQDYVNYARQNNADLLSHDTVETRDVPADNPYAVKDVLEALYAEFKDEYNLVIGPFGTKPQVIGVFLFCRKHHDVQVIYSFPAAYTHSYLQRKPGDVMVLPDTP